MRSSEDFGDRPNRIPWPPIIYVAEVIGALALERLHQAPFPAILLPFGRPTGIIVIVAGLALDGAAMVKMRLGKANILPHRSATALLTTGAFAISRNPIYLGNTIAVGGAALAFDNEWLVAAALLAAVAVERMAMRREEAHLAAGFQELWLLTLQRRTAGWGGAARPGGLHGVPCAERFLF